jgi:putative ABC transport system permease protein
MLFELFAEAVRNCRAHWLRVLLTSSGIIWGIALFIVMVAIGNANRAHFREKMEVIGRNAVWVFPGGVTRRGSGERSVRSVVLDRKDPPRLLGSPRIVGAEPELWAQPRVMKGGGHIKVVWTLGVGPEATHIRNYLVGRGRFITKGDVDAQRRVLVIGAKVEERLFGRRSALGRQVRLDGQPFRIVGVSVPKGEQMNNMGPRDDEQVLMPITTAQMLFNGSDRIDYMIMEPRQREEGAAAIERARALLPRHHFFRPSDEEGLSFFNIADAIKLVSVMLAAMSVFLAACGVLTLAVGTIGVMNIMLVAVTERTREIGLRTALGATRRDLFTQLVCETCLVTVIAGLIGMGLGALIIRVVEMLRRPSAQTDLLVPHLHFSPGLALLAFAVLVGAGVLASLVPAARATRLDPSTALRAD